MAQQGSAEGAEVKGRGGFGQAPREQGHRLKNGDGWRLALQRHLQAQRVPMSAAAAAAGTLFSQHFSPLCRPRAQEAASLGEDCGPVTVLNVTKAGFVPVD